ncbi:hypothetical protein EDB19DRAFT_1898465 [Suillus lakei]|nr:hypothetical protein EDB19DRAFT_1898465 [Suillus lakei]
MLQDWLVHHCLNIVLQLLKLAAQSSIMLSDPICCSHYCFTVLASYIADTPEAMMLACTLEQLEIIRSHAHPDDLEEFFHEVQKFHLNGVDKPFWWDWLLVEPSRFFTPELLHHIHKKFWDHDAQWIILTVGGSKIDFRFSIIQPTTGISKLKQVMGCCHRDVHVDAAPPGVIVASPRIAAALDKFHANKQSIIAAGVHQGKGSKTIDNWQIPKLELMQSIVTSIHNSSVIAQWSADVTEHAHITKVKDPA